MVQRTKISFGSGGFLFWWQAGVLMSLQRHAAKTLANAQFHGCSAGSIIAALASCDIDMQKAKEIALRLADENELWNPKISMISKISQSIRTFLNELLPEDAADKCNGRLVIYATKVDFCSCPIMTCSGLQNFQTKNDIIEACLASIHVPFLLDGKVFYSFHEHRYIDGCLFWSPIENAINIDYNQDEQLKKKKWSIFQNFTERDFSQMIELGQNYGNNMLTNYCFIN